MKLLIVEDDLLLQEGLALGLANEGYALDCASTAAEADALIQSGEYSLVILDLGLPDKDGATLLSSEPSCPASGSIEIKFSSVSCCAMY